MSWTVLRPQIKTLLETSTKLSSVYSFPFLKSPNYPFATVLPSDQEADYNTTSENQRIYAFRVRVMHETKDSDIEEALETIEDVFDDILDLIDQDDVKGSADRIIGINLPSGYTYISIGATPSSWGEIPDENLLYAELVIQVKIIVDIK